MPSHLESSPCAARDRLCFREGRTAPAPALLSCAAPLSLAMRGVGNTVGFAVYGWTGCAKPWLPSKTRQRLPSPSLHPRCGDCCWAPLRRPAFITPLVGLGVALQSRVLTGHRLYKSYFPSLFDPPHCRRACGWLFACPKPRCCLPSQPSPTEPHSTPATEAPFQALSG